MSAAGLGFEPRLTDSESAFLPLEDPANMDVPAYSTIETAVFQRPFLCAAILFLNLQKSADSDSARDDAQKNAGNQHKTDVGGCV